MKYFLVDQMLDWPQYLSILDYNQLADALTRGRESDFHLANRLVRDNERRNIAHYIYRSPQTIQPSIEDTARKMRQ